MTVAGQPRQFADYALCRDPEAGFAFPAVRELLISSLISFSQKPFKTCSVVDILGHGFTT